MNKTRQPWLCELNPHWHQWRGTWGQHWIENWTSCKGINSGTHTEQERHFIPYFWKYTKLPIVLNETTHCWIPENVTGRLGILWSEPLQISFRQGQKSQAGLVWTFTLFLVNNDRGCPIMLTLKGLRGKSFSKMYYYFTFSMSIIPKEKLWGTIKGSHSCSYNYKNAFDPPIMKLVVKILQIHYNQKYHCFDEKVDA